jgi:hypothetical protein
MRSQAVDEGHCGLPTGELVPLTAELLETQQELVDRAEPGGERRDVADTAA